MHTECDIYIVIYWDSRIFIINLKRVELFNIENVMRLQRWKVWTLSQQINLIFFPCQRATLRMAIEVKTGEEYIHKCMLSCSSAVVLDISHEENRFAQRAVAKPLNVSTNYVYTLITWISTGLQVCVHVSSRFWRTCLRPPDASDRTTRQRFSTKVNNSQGNWGVCEMFWFRGGECRTNVMMRDAPSPSTLCALPLHALDLPAQRSTTWQWY